MKLKLSAGMILLVVIWACSKDVASTPNFIFKPAPKEGIVASVGGVEIKEDELLTGIKSESYDLEKKLFDLKFNQLKSLIIKKIVEKDPASKGMSVDDYLNKNVLSSLKVSKERIDQFIKDRKIPTQHLNDQLKKRIEDFLKQEDKVKAVDSWLAKKTGSEKIEVYLDRPERPYYDVEIGNAPSYGPDNAKVTIVEYSDFECPFCAKGKDVVNQIKAKYGDKVRIVFKHFPLPFHKRAMSASIASMCVHKQKKEAFWKYHDLLFDNQKNLSDEGLEKMAGEVGVDTATWKACYQSDEFKIVINEHMNSGKRVGVKSTPTFFVNGRLISGAQPIAVFEEEINRHL